MTEKKQRQKTVSSQTECPQCGALYDRAMVYALIDPRTNVTRYIGCTRFDPKYRLKQHLREARAFPYNNQRKLDWLKELYEQGLVPQTQMLELVMLANAIKTEQRWIETARAEGVDLLNEVTQIREQK